MVVVRSCSRAGQRFHCGGEAGLLAAIICGGLRACGPHHRHVSLTALLHSPAVTIDRKDRPRYAHIHTHRKHNIRTPSGVDMWHLWGRPHLHRKEKWDKDMKPRMVHLTDIERRCVYPASCLRVQRSRCCRSHPFWPSSDGGIAVSAHLHQVALVSRRRLNVEQQPLIYITHGFTLI